MTEKINASDGIGIMISAIHEGSSHDDLLNAQKERTLDELQAEYDKNYFEPKKPL